MVRIAIGDFRVDGFAVVDILAFAVFKLAQLALAVQLAHFTRRGHVAVVLCIGVDHAGFFHGFHQLHGFLHGLHGQHFAQNMLAGLHGLDGEGRMLGGVVGQHHSVHVMLEKFVIVGIIGNVMAGHFLFHHFQTVDPLIANGNDLCIVHRCAVADHALAAPNADNADFDFFHCGTLLSLKG